MAIIRELWNGLLKSLGFQFERKWYVEADSPEDAIRKLSQAPHDVIADCRRLVPRRPEIAAIGDDRMAEIVDFPLVGPEYEVLSIMAQQHTEDETLWTVSVEYGTRA